ncbi:glycosyltransferase [Paenibacillus hodogayensis]|uniref:glycosyltransferase n=1 Tax=Paenibacillus hodogayensis TaxID=279208 RepID=UPI003CD08454
MHALGECLNFGISKSRYETIAKCDDDDYYAPNYLAQQVNTLERKNADLVCKRTVFMYFEKSKTLANSKAKRSKRRNISISKKTVGTYKVSSN